MSNEQLPTSIHQSSITNQQSAMSKPKSPISYQHSPIINHQQSPISINPLTDHIIQRAPAPFRFINYNQKLMMTITNDGHSGSFYLIIITSLTKLKIEIKILQSVQLSIPSNYPYSTRPRISGGGLEGQYIFARAHFHWGSRSSRGGSEHVINHRRFQQFKNLNNRVC